MGFTVAVIGTGLWGRRLIPLFQAHPLVDEVALCDLDAAKLAAASRDFGIERTYPSLEAALDSDIDAVALVTQHWLHAPQAMAALEAGKHVYSSAPVGITVDEIAELVATVERTGLTYAMGETSWYYSWVTYCQQRHEAGDFGRVIFSDADYFHDLEHGLREVFEERGGENWRESAVIPPMFYVTHCTSQIMAITGEQFTHVSGQGFVDTDPDGVFVPDRNRWSNPFSNQEALFRMSDGSSCRVGVYWRVGHPSMVQMSMYGTDATFEYTCGGARWVDRLGATDLTEQMIPGLVGPRWLGANLRRPSWLRRPRWLPSSIRPKKGVTTDEGVFLDVTALQPVNRLPSEYAGLRDMGGEWGTNYFMVNEFIDAVGHQELAPNNVWTAARYTLPGIVAHESAMAGGELREIPDLGGPPSG